MKILKIQTLTGHNDADNVMLHACFEILVRFVKLEWDDGKGWLAETFGGQHDIKKSRQDMVKWGYPKDLIKKEIEGLKYHNKINKEIWDLYNWWTKTRPARDPDKCADWDHKKMDFVYDVEDSEMLDRLVKVRRYLWT